MIPRDFRWRPYRVECTGSLLTSEVKRHRAWLVLGWGTALPAFCIFSFSRHLRIVLVEKSGKNGKNPSCPALTFAPSARWPAAPLSLSLSLSLKARLRRAIRARLSQAQAFHSEAWRLSFFFSCFLFPSLLLCFFISLTFSLCLSLSLSLSLSLALFFFHASIEL